MDLGARSLLEKSRVLERFLAEEQQDLAYKSFPPAGLRSVRGREKKTYGESATNTEISMAVRVERAEVILKTRNLTNCQNFCHGPLSSTKWDAKFRMLASISKADSTFSPLQSLRMIILD